MSELKAKQALLDGSETKGSPRAAAEIELTVALDKLEPEEQDIM